MPTPRPDRRLQKLATLQESDQRQQALDNEAQYRQSQQSQASQNGLLQMLSTLYGIQSEDEMMPLRQGLLGAQTEDAKARTAGQLVENVARPELYSAQTAAERARGDLYRAQLTDSPYETMFKGVAAGAVNPEDVRGATSMGDIHAKQQTKAAEVKARRDADIAAEQARMTAPAPPTPPKLFGLVPGGAEIERNKQLNAVDPLNPKNLLNSLLSYMQAPKPVGVLDLSAPRRPVRSPADLPMY